MTDNPMTRAEWKALLVWLAKVIVFGQIGSTIVIILALTVVFPWAH